ncbi:hypothetical protein G7Y89_g11796 [Cudoniella acicularis]|uniref:DNA 3'-5' helicase n=1 Tax=Cudoniella acicularis TaxID=354080 RepID=A0A8H4VXP0_9HELO|nr:hypothetical protein G7Y89_g11796 [Cudoniella acicularis]
MGLPMKHVSLITLTFQNSALILIMHYSRIMPLVGGHRYLTSTAVFLNEVIKLAVSLTIAMYDISRTLPPSTPATVLFEQLYMSVFSGDGWKLAIPATLYTLQNSLQYVAVSNLDAVHFQILYQLKILTTAVFSVSMLGRVLSSKKWLALLLLTFGVAIVQLPSHDSSAYSPIKDSKSRFYFPRSFHELGQISNGALDVARELTKRGVEGFSQGLAKRSATYEGIQEDLGMTKPIMNYPIGLSAVLVAAAISGLTGVYFEKVLKESTTHVTVWTRNVQLSFYSLFPALIFGVIMKDGEEISANGFFVGYNAVVWTAILFQALGGVLTAMCINYADNIAKNFATSISIILSFLFSVWFFDFRVSLNSYLGRPFCFSGKDCAGSNLEGTLLHFSDKTGQLASQAHLQLSSPIQPQLYLGTFNVLIDFSYYIHRQELSPSALTLERRYLSGATCVDRLCPLRQTVPPFPIRIDFSPASPQLGNRYIYYNFLPPQILKMDKGTDPYTQRIRENATGFPSQDQHGSGFTFAPAEPRATEWGFGPGPASRNTLPETSSFNDSVTGPFTSPQQALLPSNTVQSRLSLAPRNIYSQLGKEPRSITNADNHFRFAQNLRQGAPIDNSRPRPPNPPAIDTIDQLANAMLMQRQNYRHIPLASADPGPANFLQQPHTRIPNPLQPQKQQVTPPFNLSGFVHSPGGPQNSNSSSPYGQASSPTTRISLRRATARPEPVAQQPVAAKGPDRYIEPPRTPQHQTTVATRPSVQTLALGHETPIANGIQLVSPHELPDRFRQVFPYELFNAVQSKCFTPIYRSNDNVVVSAPTGGGKTVLLELAICRAVESNTSGQFKIVYQAPTKSLCSERVRDWSKKFSHLNLQCAELTGDTSQAEMARVRSASIIVTTPEKWDSITRKWADHHRLVQMVKLFLIDEVHILKEIRGATLEAVVSRMKSMGANVRFIALSATVPNSEDIAVWLGRDHTNQHLPAHRETFGENFRPVKLQKHVYGFEGGYMNDFAFEKILDGKLSNLIQKHSHKKPIMVFCFTRKSCEATAAMLAEWWTRQKANDRVWPAPTERIPVGSKELQNLAVCGVAFHHAGLDLQDRQTIEASYLKGDISLICCTSTLAVGVNLPCHLVVLKGTVGFQDGMATEYSDIEVMQMLGRAGRPQFDDSAVAVIMTKSDKKERYERMIAGQDVLESTLHLNLIEHLNSEIGLRTVTSLEKAKNWLAGTFLAVRMRQNPNYYNQIDGITPGGNTDERLMLVCERDVRLLEEFELVTNEQQGLKCTESGEAMSRYMVKFNTMKLLLGISEHAKTEEILNYLCQASEFKDQRMKPKERPCLRETNKSPFIKFPIKDNVSTTAHKVSLLIQAQLGGVEHPSDKDFAGLKRQFNTEKTIIFDRIQRLVRCVVDFKAANCDAVSTRHALDLARSLSAGFWENSNLQIQQIPQIGPVAVRKFVTSNINSVDKLVSLDSANIERIMSRNPPFGKNMQQVLAGFPLITLTSEIIGRVSMKSGQKPKVNVKVSLGFANAKVPVWNSRRPSLTFMAETSDGVLVHFWRSSIQKLEKGIELKFTADLANPSDEIKCYIACDDIVGTIRSNVLKPEIPSSDFPKPHSTKENEKQKSSSTGNSASGGGDEFGGDDIEDEEMLQAIQSIEKDVDDNPDAFADVDEYFDQKETLHAPNSKNNKIAQAVDSIQMANGKWTCFHQCRGGKPLKNGQLCKHKCCHEGLDKRPKARTRTISSAGQNQVSASKESERATMVMGKAHYKVSKQAKSSSKATGTVPRDLGNFSNPLGRNMASKLKLRKAGSDEIQAEEMEIVDLAQELEPASYADLAPREYRKLHKLHNKIQEDRPVRPPKQKPKFQYASGKPVQLPFSSCAELEDDIFDSSNSADDDFPSPSTILRGDNKSPDPFENGVVTFEKDAPPSSFPDDSIESLEAAMLDFDDSMMLKPPTPKLTSSFANNIFDFEAFEESDQARNVVSELVATLSEQDLPLTSSHQPSQKRGRSPSMDMPEVKHRRIAGAESSLGSNQVTTVPAWVRDFDANLIEELRDFVEFEI